MRSAVGPVLIALATIACNAIVGFGDLTKQPSPLDGGTGEDDDTDDDDDDTDGGGSHPSGEGGAASACNPSADFGAPVALEGPVNSASFENSPSLTDDELSLVFQRTIDDNNSTVMLATRASIEQAFGEPTALDLTGTDLSFMPSITRDGLTLFWSEIPDVQKGMDVFSATRTTVTGQFTHAVSTGVANQALEEQDPVVTADGDEMFFASDEAGPGTASRQISRAIRTAGEFANRQKVTELDSDGNENGIAVSKDGLTIFFGSTRTGGAGKLDVWTAHRSARTEKFGAPVVVAKVNSPVVDWPTFISGDGCRLYLGSERDGSGNLYVATRGP